jgi:integrase
LTLNFLLPTFLQVEASLPFYHFQNVKMYTINFLDVVRTKSKHKSNPTLYYRITLNLNGYIHSFETSSRIRLTPKEVKAWEAGRRDLGLIPTNQKALLQNTFFRHIGEGIQDPDTLELQLKQSLSKSKAVKQNKKDLITFLPGLFDKYIDNKGGQMGKVTKSRYCFVKAQSIDFISLRGYKRIEDLGSEYYYEFQSFLCNRLIGKGTPLSMTTAKGYMSKLMAVATYAVQLGYLEHHPFYKCSTKAPEPKRHALTDDELKSIMSARIGETEKKLSLCKELFIFSCHSGLSFSDMKSLSSEHIQSTNDGLFIIKSRVKSNVVAQIPINPTMQAILAKYRDHPTVFNSDNLLPVPCLDNYNEHLSLLRERCKLKKPLTSHIARHTFACMYLNNGGSFEVLASILGHKSIKTTQQYAKMLTSRISREASLIHHKFPTYQNDTILCYSL